MNQDSGRVAVLYIFFAAQVLGLAMTRYTQTKYFAWSPFSLNMRYAISVSLHGEELTTSQVRARYHLTEYGYEGRSPLHIMNVISQYERTYGSNDGAAVQLKYSINGREQPAWSFP